MLAPPKPPSHDELEALTREARERQLRRRLIGAACVAIVAAIGLSAYALTVGRGPNRPSDGSPGPGGAQPCRASQLSTRIVFGAATGSALGGATITNTSGGTCSLPSGRPVVRITLGGRRLVLKESAFPTRFSSTPPIRLLGSGAKAVVYLQWFNWCGKPVGAAWFSLRFRGLDVRASAGRGGPRCDSPQAGSSIFVSLPRRAQ